MKFRRSSVFESKKNKLCLNTKYIKVKVKTKITKRITRSENIVTSFRSIDILFQTMFSLLVILFVIKLYARNNTYQKPKC